MRKNSRTAKNCSRLLALLMAFAMILTFNAWPLKAEAAGKEIIILHTNDVHSRVDDKLGYGGVKTVKDQLEKEGNTVFLLDAGDTLHGLPIANLSKGENIVEIMNSVGYDAMTPGNHDFTMVLLS